MTTTAEHLDQLLVHYPNADLRLIVASVKARGCELCGGYRNEYEAILHFDHLDPATKYRTKSGKLVHLADMLKASGNGKTRYGRDTVLDEIRKCRVLCGSCHDDHTHNTQRK